MPWSCAACEATICNSSSSVVAVASNGQSGTIAAQAMYFSVWVSDPAIFILLCGRVLPLRCRGRQAVTAPVETHHETIELSHGGAARHPKNGMPLYIQSLWRYPVKSLAGERVPTTTLRPDGMAGDRIVRVRGPEGVRTSRRHYRLIGLRGTLDA